MNFNNKFGEFIAHPVLALLLLAKDFVFGKLLHSLYIFTPTPLRAGRDAESTSKRFKFLRLLDWFTYQV